jgi:hypothetical protein
MKRKTLYISLLIIALCFIALLTSCTELEAPGYITLVDNSGNLLTTNDETNTLVTMRYNEAELHAGNYYYVKGFQDVDGDGTSINLLWDVTSSELPHARWDIAAESEFNFYLYEDVSVSALGDVVLIHNANRNELNTSTVSAYMNPTLSSGELGDGDDGGLLVWSGVIESGKDSTVGLNRGYDFIGKTETMYWFKIVKIGAGTGWVDYDFNWYEHS